MEYQNKNSIEKLDLGEIGMLLREIWRGVKRLFWIPIGLAVIFSAALSVRAFIQYSPVYTASATFTVNITGQTGSTSYYNAATAKQLAKTFPTILTSGVLEDIVANDLGMAGIGASIRAEAVEDANLFTIYVSSNNAEHSHNVLLSVIENYPQIAEFVVGDTNLTLIDDSGVPSEPANSVSYASCIKKGVLAGVIIGLVVIIILTFSKATVRSEDDLKRMFSTKCFALLPEITSKKRTKLPPPVLVNKPGTTVGYSDTVKLLTRRVDRAMKENGAKVMMVTSTMAGEGKTTVAINLALTMAEQKLRVALVDCDLRNPSVHRYLDMDIYAGAAEYIEKKAEYEDVIIEKDDCLTVINAGDDSGRAAELLDSSRVGELIEKLEQNNDFVILDTPPVGMFSDAFILSENADSVLFVIKRDYAPRNKILRAVESMHESGAKLLGYVLNGVEASHGSYGYGYGSYRYSKYRKYDRSDEKHT